MSVSAEDLNRFRFRDVHPRLLLGTTSDRYAGWIGQIYSEEPYRERITRRTKSLAGANFIDEVLPVDSVREYFSHFPALEIDFTFYRPLLTREGKPTSNYHVLETYARYLGKADSVALKVPQAVFARKLRRGKEFFLNEDYLDAEMFRERFYRPAMEIMGSHIKAFLFEQEYQRKQEREEPEVLAEELGAFFRSIPEDSRYHVELRTPSYLAPPVYRMLKSGRIGCVLSHWTWLPSLRKQFQQADELDFYSGGDVVIRLLTPRGMTYEKTYALAHPFKVLVEGMLREETIDETVEIIRGVIQRGSRVWLFINNRMGGNAPIIAQRVATVFQESFG